MIILFSPYHPFLYITCLRREVQADAEHFCPLGAEWKSILPVADLAQSVLGRAVKLELHDVGVATALQNHVDASLARVVFGTHVYAEQLEEDEQDVLVVVLQVPHKLVRCGGEETPQTGKECIGLPSAYFLHELLDVERCLNRGQRGIIRQQETEEAVLNLGVGKTETVGAEFRVIILEGKITALVYHRYGVCGRNVNAVQYVLGGILVGHALQAVVLNAEQVDKVCGGAGLEPVAAEGVGVESVQHAERVVYARLTGREMVAVVKPGHLGRHLLN